MLQDQSWRSFSWEIMYKMKCKIYARYIEIINSEPGKRETVAVFGKNAPYYKSSSAERGLL